MQPGMMDSILIAASLAFAPQAQEAGAARMQDMAAHCAEFPSIVELDDGRLGCAASSSPEDLAALRALGEPVLRYVYIARLHTGDGENPEPTLLIMEDGEDS